MKAARLHEGAKQLSIEDVPEPQLRPGSAIVRVEAAFVSDFVAKIMRGEGAFPTPERPFTPGIDAVGVVESIAEDVRGIAPGDRVYCDHHLERIHHDEPDERVFIGNYALGAQSSALLAEWRDGAYAEKLGLPAACAVRIPRDIDASPAVLCRIGWIASAYAAFRKVDTGPGAVVAVNGASGLLGASAVLAALALGARRVFAIGRRPKSLAPLLACDDRVATVPDAAKLPALDAVFTCDSSEDGGELAALIQRLRRFGALLVVGAPKAPLALPLKTLLSNDITVRGSSWFARAHLIELLHLMAARRFHTSALQADTFPLERVNEALAAGSKRPDPLRHVAVTPFPSGR